MSLSPSSQGGGAQGNNHNVTSAEARRTFLQAYPENVTDPQKKLDEEVRLLVAIGAYTLDRWNAETTAEDEYTGKGKPDLKRARDTCSNRHFKSITEEAVKNLETYVHSRATYLPGHIVATNAGAMQAEIIRTCATREDEPLRRWIFIEMLKGPLATFGVIITAGIFAALVTLVWPPYRAEAIKGVETFFGRIQETQFWKGAPPVDGSAPAGGVHQHDTPAATTAPPDSGMAPTPGGQPSASKGTGGQ